MSDETDFDKVSENWKLRALKAEGLLKERSAPTRYGERELLGRVKELEEQARHWEGLASEANERWEQGQKELAQSVEQVEELTEERDYWAERARRAEHRLRRISRAVVDALLTEDRL